MKGKQDVGVLSQNKDSLQKKLSKLKLRVMQKQTRYMRVEVVGVLDDVEEAVRDIASSIQHDLDRHGWKENDYWNGYIDAKKEDKKLLVGSSKTKSKEP